MARPSIEHERQIVDWINEGRPYREIVKLYEMAFNVRLSMSTINNVRKRNGIMPRIHRDDRLVPWEVAPQHRNSIDLVGLRAEGRLRAGLTVNDQTLETHRAWRRRLDGSGLVVDYDPEVGFSWVERRPGKDLDLIREPRTRQGRRGYG